MSENLDKLKGHSNVKQDINRRQNNDVNGKDSNKLNKRINDIQKVITDPDVWNVNIASRDRMDEIEQRVEELSSRVQGIGYLVKRLVMNKLIDKDQLRVLEQPISGSADD
tara:strand:+ start:304 stop:633 length:330 start_codon:yes stop_codon:yes gene_type:complete